MTGPRVRRRVGGRLSTAAGDGSLTPTWLELHTNSHGGGPEPACGGHLESDHLATSQRIVMRVSGDLAAGKNGAVRLLGDHLGRTNMVMGTVATRKTSCGVAKHHDCEAETHAMGRDALPLGSRGDRLSLHWPAGRKPRSASTTAGRGGIVKHPDVSEASGGIAEHPAATEGSGGRPCAWPLRPGGGSCP